MFGSFMAPPSGRWPVAVRAVFDVDPHAPLTETGMPAVTHALFVYADEG